LLFAHPDANFFTADRREVLEIVAKQSVIAIQNARLYQDLEQEKNRIMEIQEESKKLARDLHDGPTQAISAIAMRVTLPGADGPGFQADRRALKSKNWPAAPPRDPAYVVHFAPTGARVQV
jgi:GAF domain-containing protein